MAMTLYEARGNARGPDGMKMPASLRCFHRFCQRHRNDAGEGNTFLLGQPKRVVSGKPR
jgi:hypothetical protein